MFCTSPINSEIPFIFTDAAIPFLPGEGGLSNGEDFPQQPAPVLIGPNSKLFGSKLNATNFKTQPLPVGFFLARRASTGGAFGGVWCFAIAPAAHFPARSGLDASLFSI